MDFLTKLTELRVLVNEFNNMIDEEKNNNSNELQQRIREQCRKIGYLNADFVLMFHQKVDIKWLDNGKIDYFVRAI